MATKGPRTMTFTGCWTCKRRKVKCDERPDRCMNCERMRIACDGYGIRLQWITDPLVYAGGLDNGGALGMGRIRIKHNKRGVYPLNRIDSFLKAVEKDGEGGIASQRGPFSVFTTRDFQRRPENRKRTEDACTSRQICIEPVKVLDGGSTPSSTVSSSEESSMFQITVPSPENFPSEVSEGLELPGQLGLPELPQHLEELPDIQADLDYTDGEVPLQSTPDGINRRQSLAETVDTPLSLSSSISGDVLVDKLMHHYIIHIASLLQPIQHPSNPYRNLYAPAALQATSGQSLVPMNNSLADTSITVHAVLLRSLLASSAFHLWNCNPTQVQYHIIGSRFRQQALQLLQSALRPPMSAAEYQTLMMAMLSLVTVDVMSGCEADFMIHLQGTRQLQDGRRHWKMVSKATRQLNEISDFLFLLARTMTSPKEGMPLSIAPGDATAHSSDGSESCFAHMYGTTPRIAAYIQETCQLSEELGRYKKHGTPYPDTLLESCESLGDRLLSWTLEAEDSASIFSSSSDDMAIFCHHARAWHQAALIYYYRHIQKLPARHYVAEIGAVVECMLAVEDIKSRPRLALATRMAPITWPALMASCDGLLRERWREWWERVQCYRIANIQRQWEFVQRMWEEKDGLDAAGQVTFDWVKVFQSSQLSLLPV